MELKILVILLGIHVGYILVKKIDNLIMDIKELQ